MISFKALDPPFEGFSPGDRMHFERVQRGAAQHVEIWHTSKMGMYTYEGDVDVIVNGLHQPNCENAMGILSLFCNHLASLILYEYVANMTDSFSASIHENGELVKDSDAYLIGLYNDHPIKQDKPKKLYLKTDPIFEAPEQSFSDEFIESMENKKDLVGKGVKKVWGKVTGKKKRAMAEQEKALAEQGKTSVEHNEYSEQQDEVTEEHVSILGAL